MADGLMMFAKYAFPPNYLNLCGPSKNKELFEIISENDSGPELKNLLTQFEGAFPYLRLIAQNNNIKNTFDEKVVEAYWIGNNLLENVDMKYFYPHIENRFKKKMAKKDWSWLVSKSIPTAKPFHGFHVFDIYRRAGLLRSGEIKNIIETMDKCRISWGKIESINFKKGKNLKPFSAIVRYNPLEFKEKKIVLGKNIIREFLILGDNFKINDDVSLHWDYICDKITLSQKKNLIYWTKYHLGLTNQTI